MNERIKKLAMETDAWCDMNAIGDAKYNIIWEEKFAELIVRECADIATKHQEQGVSEVSIGESIKEHFGVER